MTSVRLVEGGAEGRYVLSGELTFESVPELAAEAESRFGDCPELHIDLGDVERVDSAGLALLVEWTREARRCGRAVRFERAPDQLMAIAQVSGLDKLLPFDRED